ncbi:Hypothetical predicted protein, partial [Mytilus galloprovincialis]
MLPLILICTIFSVGRALVCTPELCKNAVQEPLNCKGSIIKNGGFCGCYDVCAKQEGEECQAHYSFGMIPAGKCDSGMVCTAPIEATGHPMMLLGRGQCVKTDQADLRRAIPDTLSACQQMRRVRMISMVVWQGWWMPKCDVNGDFMDQQCDNMKRCFCVDSKTGDVDKTTYTTLGAANCAVSKRDNTMTKCQQKYASMQFSFAIWQGMWYPKCDTVGNFEPEQCDNTGKCFCVSAVDGVVDESTKVLGSADCSSKKRQTLKKTKCQQKYASMQFSFAIWQGMWYPKCDTVGNFEPEQCDNTGKCFCVSAVDGVVDESTKVLGSADCSSKKRQTLKKTKCQQKYASMQFSFAIWQGMWYPKCDALGNFMPEQCDNTGKCFCVSAVDGVVDESTKVLGSAECSSKKRQTLKKTKCQQMRDIRMISFVVWKGMWTPKCDALGNFMPEQCDNTKHCFCVDAVDGTVDVSTKVLDSADCSQISLH